VTAPEAGPRPRQPLLLVVFAFLIIVLRPEFGGYDGLPDALGWLLLAVATAQLPADVPRRSIIIGSALVAMVPAAVMVKTSLNEKVLDLDSSLQWAIGLPGVLFSILFCLAIAWQAQGDLVASLLWKYLAFGWIASAVFPIIVDGGGLDSLSDVYASVSAFAQLGLFALALLHAWKPWALIPPEI
jgi:hypothetical protein